MAELLGRTCRFRRLEVAAVSGHPSVLAARHSRETIDWQAREPSEHRKQLSRRSTSHTLYHCGLRTSKSAAARQARHLRPTLFDHAVQLGTFIRAGSCGEVALRPTSIWRWDVWALSMAQHRRVLLSGPARDAGFRRSATRSRRPLSSAGGDAGAVVLFVRVQREPEPLCFSAPQTGH
jgi:hypothetical protein